MLDPVKIYEGVHDFGEHEAAIYVPGPDGHVEDGNAYAKSLWEGVKDSVNPFNKKSAYEAGRSTANAATIIVPAGAEIKALGELRGGMLANEAEATAARAAAERAAGTPEEATLLRRAQAAEVKAAAAKAAYQTKLPGAGVRKVAARAKTAADKAKARRLNGEHDAHDPLTPHTPKSLAKRQAAAAGLRGKWQGGTHGRPPENRNRVSRPNSTYRCREQSRL